MQIILSTFYFGVPLEGVVHIKQFHCILILSCKMIHLVEIEQLHQNKIDELRYDRVTNYHCMNYILVPDSSSLI